MLELLTVSMLPLALIGVLVVAIFCCETESPTVAFFIAAAGLASYFLFNNINIFTWLQTNALILFFGTLIYLIIGGIWSIYRWWDLCNDTARRLINDPLTRTAENIDVWIYNRMPKILHSKRRIIAWIELWPASMFWYLFSKVLTKVGRWIYDRLGRVYQRILDSAISRIKEAHIQKKG